MLGLVLGFKATDRIQFEAGFGLSQRRSGIPGSKDDDFCRAICKRRDPAPGVYIVPEVGYQDFMDDAAGNDEGYQWYARRQVADRTSDYPIPHKKHSPGRSARAMFL